VSPSGITIFRGNRIPEWENNLFMGALSGQHIVRLVIENNRVTGEGCLQDKINDLGILRKAQTMLCML
jgi:glucose/arabinose dehydrogenase